MEKKDENDYLNFIGDKDINIMNQQRKNAPKDVIVEQNGWMGVPRREVRDIKCPRQLLASAKITMFNCY